MTKADRSNSAADHNAAARAQRIAAKAAAKISTASVEVPHHLGLAKDYARYAKMAAGGGGGTKDAGRTAAKQRGAAASGGSSGS
jgi:hypothetical protein